MRLLFILSAVFLIPSLSFCQISLINGRPTYYANSSSNNRDTFEHRVVGINVYTHILEYEPCHNTISFDEEASDDFFEGDTILIIQMKGAVIDSSNTSNFGTLTDYKYAGNYEFNYVKSISGNVIELKNKLTRQYDISEGKVQLIRVPYFQNLDVNSELNCMSWDGNIGGVLVITVRDTLTLNEKINASGTGFRGGRNLNILPNTLACSQSGYYYDSSSWQNGCKGEGIASVGFDKIKGRGKLANGGGGGNGHNAGGGGGSNNTPGGFGGYQLDSCGNSPYDNRGIGGTALTYNNSVNKIFLGGGGGAGHNDGTDTSFFSSPGGVGAGIIIIKAGYIISNNHTIFSNGSVGELCTLPGENCHHDGMGGGGAGGTIVIDIKNIVDTISLNVTGGDGNNVGAYSSPSDRLGPGGGGSGGVIWFSNNSTPLNSRIYKNGGTNGVILADSNNPWGASAGSEGTVLNNLLIPVDTVLFITNIDSVGIADMATSCNSFNFNGFVNTNTGPITNWEWYFGDGDSALTQNTSHIYSATGIFPVQLIVSDANGCRDSVSVNVNSYLIAVDAGTDTTICANSSVVLQGSNIGGTQFTWTPAQYLNDNTLLNPIANPPVTTMYHLVAMNDQGCAKTDSVLVAVHSINLFSIDPPFTICKNDSTRIHASGGTTYLWSPGNATIPDPLVVPQSTTDYSVRISDTICNVSTLLSTKITVLPLPDVEAGKLNDLDCSNNFSQLTATGAIQYLWSPAGSLSNPNIADPIARPTSRTQYRVKGTGVNGCVNYDTVTVDITAFNKGASLMPSAFTPNNDGLNDCFGIRYWGVVEELDFSIYNRWGEMVFHTKKAGDCWNGLYKGVPQNPDVYVYIITAKTACGSVFRKGTFALIR